MLQRAAPSQLKLMFIKCLSRARWATSPPCCVIFIFSTVSGCSNRRYQRAVTCGHNYDQALWHLVALRISHGSVWRARTGGNSCGSSARCSPPSVLFGLCAAVNVCRSFAVWCECALFSCTLGWCTGTLFDGAASTRDLLGLMRRRAA